MMARSGAVLFSDSYVKRWRGSRRALSPVEIPEPVAMEPGVGRASRWNTLRALRVLDWYGS